MQLSKTNGLFKVQNDTKNSSVVNLLQVPNKTQKDY